MLVAVAINVVGINALAIVHRDGSQALMNATSYSAPRICRPTRMLPVAAYGRQGCSIVAGLLQHAVFTLSVCLSVLSSSRLRANQCHRDTC